MLFSLAFTAILLTACVYDLISFRIPNALPLALIAVFVIRATAFTEIAVWPGHIMAGVLMLALGFLAFATGVMGGGDAKLMSAIALWFGIVPLPTFIAGTAICGGVLALVLLAVRQLVDRSPATLSPPGPPTGSPHASPHEKTRSPRLFDRQAPIPYALPISLVALWLEWSTT